MKRWMTVLSALMLLISVLTVPAMAMMGVINGSPNRDSEGGSDSHSPVVKQEKETVEIPTEEATAAAEIPFSAPEENTVAAEETTCPTEETGWRSTGGAEEAAAETQAQPLLPSEETEEPEESFLKKLFVRKVAEKEIWKIAVPAAGTAAAVAALLLQRKKTGAAGPARDQTSRTVMGPWDNQEK